MMEIFHEQFMRRCLELAARGRGKTGINPMVGAVLVRDGMVKAEAFHAEFGKAHAEAELIKKFDQKFQQKDILYVNLEPCCHTKKKTPPCTDIIIKSGVKHVVFGMLDSNPSVSGKGIEALRKAGIEVTGPILEDECRRLNRGFISLQKKHRPWITLKRAQTKTGKIANEDGSMMAITSAVQNAWSHEFLRARHDAILVGVGTIVTDNSGLTVRIGGHRMEEGGQPYRIVLDPDLQTPLTAMILNDRYVSKTIILCSSNVDVKKKAALEQKGVRICFCPFMNGIFDWKSLWKILITPHDAFYGISSILVEGGPATWKAFQKAKTVDEEIILIGA